MPDPEVTAHLARTIPVGRTGTPDDVGAACVWLGSDEAAWVTGQTIELNGGSITTAHPGDWIDLQAVANALTPATMTDTLAAVKSAKRSLNRIKAGYLGQAWR